MPGLPIVEADSGALSFSVAAPCSICIPAFNSTAVFEAVSLFCICEN